MLLAIDPFFGSLAQGAANLGSGLLNLIGVNKTNKNNLKIMREQNKFNLEQLQREADFTREMWNANNEYNDPSKQMQRLTDAGLSPWAAAQVMGAGDASGVATPSTSAAAPATMQSPDFSFLGSATQSVLDGYYKYRMQEEQVRKTAAEADSAETDAAQKTAYFNEYWRQIQQANLNNILLEGDNKTKDSALKQQSIELNEGNFLMNQQLMRQQYRKAELEIGMQELQNYAERVENKMRELRLNNLPAQLKAELALTAAQQFAAVQSGNASSASAAASFQQAAKTKLEAAGVKTANKVAKSLADATIRKVRAEAHQAEIDKYGKYIGAGRGLAEYIKNSWRHFVAGQEKNRFDYNNRRKSW